MRRGTGEPSRRQRRAGRPSIRPVPWTGPAFGQARSNPAHLPGEPSSGAAVEGRRWPTEPGSVRDRKEQRPGRAAGWLGSIRSIGVAAGALAVVLAGYVAVHELAHVSFNAWLVGRIAGHCGTLPFELGPGWEYVVSCYAGRGLPGANAATALTVSALYGGAVVVLASRVLPTGPALTGCAGGGLAALAHLGHYLADTTALGGSSIPTDSAVVLDTLGPLGLVPPTVGLGLSLLAVIYVSWSARTARRPANAAESAAHSGGPPAPGTPGPRELACRDAGYDCEFLVRSADESQLIRFAQVHAREVHGAELSSGAVRNTWKTV